jgi:phospholipid/cholesterol/gamma-HCH transport system substrate-binding protein
MRFTRFQAYGVAMVAALAVFVGICIAYFNQAFTPVSHVTLLISRSGLQLLPGSDVKVRGLIIGSVSDITSDGNGATVSLHLDPAKARRIPDNVSARLIPTTLFGEKYIDLVIPEQPSGRTLADGAVIPEDRSEAALEINQALNDLLPLLRTVKPGQLNMTLTALATALTGRGEQLGRTIEQLDTYFRAINPHLPALQHDLEVLADVAGTYETAAGPLMDMLANLTVTSRTVVDRKEQLRAFLTDVTGAADTTRDLLLRNEVDILRVNKVNRGVLELLARYAPEYPCFFRGYAGLIDRIHAALPDKLPGSNRKNASANVVIEFVPSFPTYQYPIDLPEFKDTRGPNCYGLPNPPMSLPRIQFKDGTEDDPRFNPGAQVGAQSTASTVLPSGSPSMGAAGTAEEQQAMSSLLGPVLGMPSAQVPDLATLLFGPMGRGATVDLS